MNNLGVKLVTGVIVGFTVGVGVTVIKKMIQNRIETNEIIEADEVIVEESE